MPDLKRSPEHSTAAAWSLLVTCEHGGCRVPAAYRPLFATSAARAALASHRGWDPGALELARTLARQAGAPLVAATVSRLVVELNRSPGHPRLWSEFTRPLDAAARRRLLAAHYEPHRRRVAAWIEAELAAGQAVVHLGVHSFTPVLDGDERRCDIGLLYDPRRPLERALCRRWAQRLRQARPDLRVRFNYPYRGGADGLTTALRRRYSAEHYVGIELEVNQRYPLGERSAWRRLQRDLAAALTLADGVTPARRAATLER